MLPRNGEDELAGGEGSGQAEQPVNREAMLGAFRGSLSYDVYQEYQRLQGDDQLMMFYLSWWQRGLTKANVVGAAVDAGYPKEKAVAVAQHPAVRFLYQSLGRGDVVLIAEITQLFFEGIKVDMKSEDEGTRTKCYATWNNWMRTNAVRVDAQLARTERLKRAAVDPPASTKTIEDIPIAELERLAIQLDEVLKRKYAELKAMN
jgi:hypothetical protein